MAQIDLRNSTITIWDGGENHIAVKIGEGNLSYSEKRNIEHVKRRGLLTTVREGDEEQLELELAFVWEYITSVGSSDPPTVEDALKRKGPAAAWASTSPDPKAPYCVNLQVDYQPPCIGEAAWETIVFPEFHYSDLHHSLKDATVDLKGTCNRVMASPTRVTPVV